MAERIHFATHPPEPIRLAVCVWLRHHGIDPNLVPSTSPIERRAEQRQIIHDVILLDEDGTPRLDPTGDDIATETRIVQLEAIPAPIPEAVLEVAEVEMVAR